ncbi:MAG: AsmA-like C-terminal region-containing protein [Pseudomonadota bacterium]
MVRQTTKVIFFEILGGLSLLLIAAVVVLAIRLASGPVELQFLESRVERSLIDLRGGNNVEIDRLTLQWVPSTRRVEIVAYDVALYDRSDKPVGLGEQARIKLDAGALLTGNIEILSADIEGGWLTAQNASEGIWIVAGTVLPKASGGELPETPSDWILAFNEQSSSIIQNVRDIGALIRMEAFAFDRMEVRLLDASETSVGTITNASAALRRENIDWFLALSGNGEGVGLPGGFSVSLETVDEAQGFTGRVDIEDWAFSELIDLAGLSGFEQAESMSFTTSLSLVSRADAGLQEVGLTLTSENDQSFTLFNDELQISDIDVDLTYLPEEDSLIIQSFDLQSNLLSGQFEGQITNALTPNELHAMDLRSDSFVANFTPYFPQAWSFQEGQVSATISDDFQVFAIERLSMIYGPLRFSAMGELDLDVTSQDGEFPFALDVSAEAVGETSKETVLSFWPETLGDGGRRFVRDRLETGTLTGATAVLSLKPDSRAQGFLRDEDLNVNFSFREGRVRFLTDMPPVENAVGTGRLTGNSFRADVSSATYDDWTISQGRFDFPELNPRGKDFIVTAEGRGPAVSILRQLSNSRVRLQENTGFDPERVSGVASASLRFRRRSTGQVPFEETQLQVSATIEDAGLENVLLEQSMTDGRVDVDLTQERLVLSGFADLGPIPVQFSWRDGLNNEDPSADLSASAIINPTALNELGLFGRAYLTGDIPVNMQGQVGRDGLGDAQFGFDLRGARIAVDEIGWTKPAGDPARAVINYDGQGRENVSSVRLETDTAVIDGDIELQSDGRLKSLLLRRFFVDGLSDVSGEISRKDDGSADIRLVGSYLNLEPTLNGIGSFGGTESTALGIALNVTADVEQLRLRKGLDLVDATAALETSATALLRAEANGQTQSGDGLLFSYNAEGDVPKVRLETENAGFLAEAFFGFDFIEGGDLKLNGRLSENGEPSRILAEIRDARLVNAPFVTQILSLASLRGLSDTLSGDGVLFSNITVPISIGGGRYVIEGGRASGPALGLTMNGWIATDQQGIELDGVLVPSFGVNSALGGVPIIGDLFVGRKGEGIFSITYSVSGTLDRAQVAVNPLSAVTPGILRRIFENPSDTTIPDALPVDPDLKPPSELPELPDDEVIAPTPGAG